MKVGHTQNAIVAKAESTTAIGGAIRNPNTGNAGLAAGGVSQYGTAWGVAAATNGTQGAFVAGAYNPYTGEGVKMGGCYDKAAQTADFGSVSTYGYTQAHVDTNGLDLYANNPLFTADVTDSSGTLTTKNGKVITFPIQA